MIKYVWILFILLYVPSTVLAQDLELAEQYMSNQEYSKALDIYETCVQKDSSEHACIEKAGMAAYYLGQTRKSKEYFHLNEKHPDYFKKACIQLAAIYESQEHIPKATKYYSILKDSFPDNFLYYRKLGTLYDRANLVEGALGYYTQALELNPEDLITIRGMSNILIDNAKHATADSLLQVGLQKDSLHIGLNLLKAKNHYRQKQYPETVEVLEFTDRWTDLNNYYNKMLGYAYLQIDSVDNAIYHLNLSLVNEGNPEFAHYYLGVAYEKKEDVKEAVFHLRKAVDEGTSRNLDLYNRILGKLLDGEGETKESIKAYEWSYRYNQDPVLLFYLGRASDKYYKDKNIAIRYYQRYIKSKHENKEYKDYSKQRVRYLKEYSHQQSASNG